MTETLLGANRIGGPGEIRDDATVRAFVARSLAGADLDGHISALTHARCLYAPVADSLPTAGR